MNGIVDFHSSLRVVIRIRAAASGRDDYNDLSFLDEGELPLARDVPLDANPDVWHDQVNTIAGAYLNGVKEGKRQGRIAMSWEIKRTLGMAFER